MNAFIELAARQMSAPAKAYQRAAEKRAATREEKALAERDATFRAWRLWRRERLDTLLNGPRGDAVRELVTFLQGMKLGDDAALLAHVRAGNWHQADAKTKSEVLALINTAIVRTRELAGLKPFDDGLPGEPPTAFPIVRELFR